MCQLKAIVEQVDGSQKIVMEGVTGVDVSHNGVTLKTFFEENCRRGNDGSTFFQLLIIQMFFQFSVNQIGQNSVYFLNACMNWNRLILDGISIQHFMYRAPCYLLYQKSCSPESMSEVLDISPSFEPV